MNTRLGVVIDALVSTMTTALPNVLVLDGPPVRGATTGTSVLAIGWDGTEEGDEAGTSSQEWAGIGNHARNENLTVTCYAESTSGETTAKTVRDAALAVVQAVETALRSDPQLGGALTGPSYAQFGEISGLRQPQTSEGVRAGVVFTVTAFARI